MRYRSTAYNLVRVVFSIVKNCGVCIVVLGVHLVLSVLAALVVCVFYR